VIPRSRKIIVDGHRLRWSMPARRPRPLRCWETGPNRNAATLTVQHESGKGGVAQTVLTWLEGMAVTPEVVAIVVRRMLAAGWRPAEKGSPFLMDTVAVGDLDTRENVARAVMES
jgi:hypothetical protein